MANTTYHFDNATGNNANAGTAALPKKNPDSVTWADGDVLLGRGDLFSQTPGASCLVLTGRANVTIAQWATNGAAPICFRGDVLVSTWAKTATYTNLYNATITTGLALQSSSATTSVMVGAGKRRDANDRHCPFLYNVFAGVVTTAVASATVTGTNTMFTKTFAPADTITVGATTRTILSIESDTSLTLTANFGTLNTNAVYTSTGVLATNLTFLDAHTWAFYYNSVTGLLYVNLGGVVPTDADGVNQISYTTGAYPVLGFSGCTGIRAIGVRARWCNVATAGAYVWQFTNCTGTRLINCEGVSGGAYHVFTFTSSTQAQSDNQMWYCEAHGVDAYVYYASGFNVYDCVDVGCRAYNYPRITPTGAPINITTSTTAFLSHTNDADSPNDGPWVTDVLRDHCVVYGYMDCGPGLRDYDAANSYPASNIRDASTYAVRMVDCATFGGVQTVFTDSHTRVRHLWDQSFCSASKASYASGAGSGGGGLTFTRGAGLGSYCVLLESCVISFRLDQEPGSVGEHFVGFSTEPNSGYTARLILKNCTMFENGEAETFVGVRSLFKQQNSTNGRCIVEATQSTIGYALAPGGGSYNRLMTNDATAIDSCYVFRNNAYMNISAPALPYSASSSTSGSGATLRSIRNTFFTAGSPDTGWSVSIDTGGIVPSAYPQNGSSHFLDPDITSAFRASSRDTAGHAEIGFGLQAYSGQYGAGQYGNATVLADVVGDGGMASDILRNRNI